MANLKPGSSTISKIYAGSSEVQKVYAGSTLVYQVSVGTDWDTYENGIWQEVENHDTVSFYVTGGYVYYGGIGKSQLKTMTTNQSTWGDYILGWWSYSNRPTAQASSSSITDADAPPYIAVWDCDLGQWLGVKPYSGNSFGRIIYDDGGANRLFNTPNTASKTNNCVFVGLTQDPGDISGWRDYDGPDDWDTWEDGIVCYPDPGTSYGTSSALVMTDVKATSSYDTPVRFTQKSSTTLWLQRADNSVNGGLLTSYPPYIALWWERTGSTVVRTWFVAEYSGSGATYNFVEAANGYTQFHATSNSTGDLAIVSLTGQPNNLSNWRDYDGPLFASWDAVDRVTLVAGASGVATTRINIDYYETGSFWTTISQSGTDEMVPIALDRGGTSLVNMQLDSGDVMNRDTLNSNVSSAALWLANKTSPYNGWQNVPLTSTGAFKTNYVFDMSPTSLDYNNFYTYEPAAVVLFNKDAGDTRYWPAYDGPVANWDTYANGVKFFSTISTSSQNPVNVPSYPATTYSSAPSSILLTSTSSPVTNGLYIEHVVYDPSQTLSDSNMPPYIAMYYNEAQAVGGFGDMPPGWYVFQNYDQTFRPRGRTTWEKPIAWPTPSGNYNYYSNVIDTGYASSSNTSGPFAVFLDEYNDPLGSGGTDHWTPPPYISYANPSTVLTNGIATTQSSGFDIQTDPGTYCTEYGFGDIRNSGTCRVRAAQTLGTREIDVYNGTTLYATGVGTFTGTALTTASLTVQSGFTGNVFTDFNPVGTDADPAMIIVYTHVDRP